jgi:hypothetical protein
MAEKAMIHSSGIVLHGSFFWNKNKARGEIERRCCEFSQVAQRLAVASRCKKGEVIVTIYAQQRRFTTSES